MAAHAGPDSLEDGLVLHLDAANRKSYPGSGTVWTDMSGNGNNGTLVNGPTFSSLNNGSIVFDGFNDHVPLGTYNSFGTINRTVSVWFRIATIGQVQRVISFTATSDTSTDTPAYTIGINTSGILSAGFGGSPYNGYANILTVSNQNWMNVTSSITGNTITNYLNGNLVSSATNTATVSANPVGVLGRYNNFYGQYLSGNISQVAVYNRALSANEIKQIFNAIRGRYGI